MAGLALLALAADARADANEAPLAETLFREGKSLMEAKDYAKACPKLEESQRLDPATGTLLALALCLEAEGKTASAWAAYSGVAVAAQKDGRADRLRLARERVAALEPTLSRLQIDVTPAAANVAGFELRRDGTVLGRAAWGTATPVDPGEHVVEASAPGRKPWRYTVAIGARSDRKTVVVPPLAATGEVGAVPPPAAAPASEGIVIDQRKAGFIVGGAGVIALAVGGIFGVRALSKNGDAKERCDPASCTSAEGLALNSDARSAATVANIAIGVGLAAVATGTVLVVLAPSPDAAAPRGAYASIRGSW